MNAGDIKAKLSTPDGRADRLAKSQLPADQRIAELYQAAFARAPRADELKTALEFLAEPRLGPDGQPINPQQAGQENFKDLIWAIINTKEFLFNH
jgi:hypothetical protein